MTEHFTRSNDILNCDGISFGEIAARFGTPTYVYSAAACREAFSAWSAAFSSLPHTLCYAVKANSNGAIIRLFAEEGAGFDIVSGGELYRVIQAGGDPRRCVFAGVGKTADDIRYALENDILFFCVESAPELHAIEEIAHAMGVIARVAIRVNPDVDPETHKYITTGKSENKFGLDIVAAEALYDHAHASASLRPVGVQMHIGSQITRIEPFITATKKLAAFIEILRSKGIDIQHVDVGGGLGIIYKDETPPTPREFADALAPHLATLNAHIHFEPGRSLVGNAGVLLTRVVYVKKQAQKTFVITDAGMNDLLRPSLYGAYHSITPVVLREGEEQVCDIVGPICETGDFYATDRLIPPVQAGDILAVMSAGAYGFSMASTYNSRPRAAEVLVDANESFCVRRRETWDDLITGEIIPTKDTKADA